MDTMLALARDWGSWAGAALALAIALRTSTSTNARTVEQLRRWLIEARDRIQKLERQVEKIPGLERELAECKRRDARNQERLAASERRNKAMSTELTELRESIGAGGGAARRAASLVHGDEIEAEVIEMTPRLLRAGEDG